MNLARVFILVFLTVSLATACAGTQQPLTYLSLGDSLAVGVGSSDPRELGYVPLYREALEEETGREVRLVRLGLSGETSGSFVNGPSVEGGEAEEGSQLSRAEDVLRENPGAAVTISVGGNDLLRAADGTAPERAAALDRYAGNLDRILGTLESASDPSPSITILTLYNPAPGTFTDEWSVRLNGTIREVAARNGVRVAEVGREFRGQEAEYLRQARYPWDIHPNDRGHEALARALMEATSGR